MSAPHQNPPPSEEPTQVLKISQLPKLNLPCNGFCQVRTIEVLI